MQSNLKNDDFIDDEDMTKIKEKPSVKFNLIRQISAKAEEKIDKSELQVKQYNQLLEQPIFTLIRSVGEQTPNVNNKDIIITTTSTHTAIDIDKHFHRDIKPGSQRCRWNLLFNFLIWLIVPFPIWIPFISNTVAYYTIMFIQFVFVLMWISKCYMNLRHLLLHHFLSSY